MLKTKKIEMNYDLAILHYNLRCHDFAFAADEATKKLKLCPKNSKDYAKWAFWKYCANGFCGSHQSAIRGLEILRKKFRSIDYAVISALIWFHERCNLVDEGDLRNLGNALKKAETNIDVDGALLAADFFFHTASYEAASSCLNLPSLLHSHNGVSNENEEVAAEIYRIRFWISLSSAKDVPMLDTNLAHSSLHGNTYFDENVDCLMVQAKHHENSGNHKLALEILSDLIIKHPIFYPALIESAKIQLKDQQYSLARSSIQRALKLAKNDRECFQVYTLLSFVTNCNKEEQTSNMNKLLELSSSAERASPKACYESACLFSTISDNGNKQVLGNSLRFISIASEIDPTNELYSLEKAQILLRLGRAKDAYKEYQSILKSNEECIEALLGCVMCQIFSGNKSEAFDQLEFISISIDDEITTKMVSFQKKVIRLFLSNDEQQELLSFTELIEDLMKIFSTGDIWIHGISVGNIDEVTKLFVTRWSKNNISKPNKMDKWNAIADRLISLLKSILERFPCNTSLWTMLMKLCLQRRRMNEATAIVNQCLAFHPELVPGQLLKAQIELEDKNTQSAKQSLERALSIDLEICHHPFYKLLKGSLSLHEGNLGEAKSLLTSANEKDARKSNNGSSFLRSSSLFLFTDEDRLACHMNLCKVLKLLDEPDLFQESCLRGEHRFVGASVSFNFIKMKCDFFLEQDEIEKALAVIRNILPDSLHYDEAQLELAGIYLNREKNIQSFLQCYQNLAKHKMISKTQIQSFIGDAYMNAAYFRHALNAYSIADNPQKDVGVTQKHGQMLIICQDFQKARKQLEKSFEKQIDMETTMQLIELSVNTQQLPTAEDILTTVMNKEQQGTINQSELLHLTLLRNIIRAINSRVEENKETGIVIIGAIKEFLAKEMNFSMTQTSSSRNVCGRIKEIISNLVVQEIHSLPVFDLILQIVNVDSNTLFAAIELAYKEKEYEVCRKYCRELRQLCPSHEGAVVMSGRLLMTDLKFDEALTLYETFLTSYPCSYSVIFEQLKLLYRSGRFDEVSDIVNKLERTSSKKETNISYGYYMCMGIYYQNVGELGRSLEYFNYARGSNIWHVEATIIMVEIYLQLENLNLWKSFQTGTEKGRMESIANSIQQLLNNLAKDANHKDDRIQTLMGYQKLLMSILSQRSPDNVVSTFQSILHSHKDYVPALVGLASTFLLQGNMKKSRSILKRIAKLEYCDEYWKEFERGYMFLAAEEIQREKLDLALDLCKRCLFYNKSCGMALMLMGNIFDKQNKNIMATKCFKKDFGQKQSFLHNVELSKLYLKSGNYFKAIDVATKVMVECPDFDMTSILEDCVQSVKI